MPQRSPGPGRYVGSTSGIIDYAGKSDAKEFIIGTEGGVFYELETRNPGKTFYPAMEDAYCINMKKVTLEKVRDACAMKRMKSASTRMSPEKLSVRWNGCWN